MNITLIVSLFLIEFFAQTNCERLINCKIKALTCENVGPSIYNGTFKCWFKATKDGHGITNIRYTFGAPANNLWVDARVFYKFPIGGTHFRPWVGNFDVDFCDFMQNRSLMTGNRFFIILVNSLVKNTKGLMHKCPYFGEEGLVDADIHKIMGDALPQIIPKGFYRIVFRFHLADNSTIFIASLTTEVDAVNPLESINIMG